jgi:flagellar biosynthetic protein FliR
MTPLVTVDDAVTLVLVMSRIIALMMAFPFFNTNMIPLNVKVLLVTVLAFFLMKVSGVQVSAQNFSFGLFVLLIFKELLIGFALGLLANIFIAAFSYAAEIISYFMGLTVVNSFDPTYGQVSVLSRFFIMLFYFIFFASGAYQYFFASLISSLQSIPLDQLSFNQGLWRYIIELSKEIFSLAFKLAFPFALILYMINLSLALVNRLIPQINVFIVGLPLQIFVGLAALAFGASVVVYAGSSFLAKMVDDYLYLLKHLG